MSTLDESVKTGTLGCDIGAAPDSTQGSRGHRLVEAALAYAGQGLAVFPLHNPLPDGRCSCGAACKSPGKHPRTPNGLKAATINEDQIRGWWTMWPDANIGIATGAASAIVIVDVDGAEGEASLRCMTEKFGPLPATMKATTGRGCHLYFKAPAGRVKSKAPFCRDFPHVDSRGDGGYVVAPPSLHASGTRYAVDPSMPSELADAPAWLIDLINGKQKGTGARTGAAANDSIADGSRNCTLASLAGTMRGRGMTQGAIEAALLEHNRTHCSPPLDDDEVRRIAHSIASYPSGSPSDVLRTLNDAGNADRFAQKWGIDVRFVPELKKWLVWEGTHWQPDTTGAVVELAKKTAFDIYHEGDQVSDSDIRKKIVGHSATSLQASRIDAMLKLARSIPELVVPVALLDADPWLLGVENGTIDLRCGDLRPAEREDYITKPAPVVFDTGAESPTFLGFLNDIMGGDQQLVDYVQRVFGYTLTGDVSEQCLFFLFGTGANGKSTLLNVCKSLLGSELCRQTPVETIMAGTKNRGPTPELACLKSPRAVLTTEVDEGSFLSESLVKQMTGGDFISARHLFGEPFDFAPQFKLFAAGNHKPNIRGGDDGIWRRIHLIPFTITVPPEKRDPRLAEKLRAEASGILNWALRGCREWQIRRLDPPPAVVTATAEYKEDMDILGQWLSDRCELGPDLSVSGSSAYIDYRPWAEVSGLRPWSHVTFGQKLKERFECSRTSSGYVYSGFRLRPPDHSVAQPPGIPKAKI